MKFLLDNSVYPFYNKGIMSKLILLYFYFSPVKHVMACLYAYFANLVGANSIFLNTVYRSNVANFIEEQTKINIK